MPKRQHVIAAVASTILLTCAGLLFPAIQRVREVADRMSCAGRFSQLGVAMHNYASTDDKFPAGTVAQPDLPPDQRLSWRVPLLPYVEQGNIYKLFDLTLGPRDERNARAMSHRWPHLVCPSSGEHHYDNATGDHWKSPTPLTHYVAISGVGADAATLPLGHPRAGAFGYDRRTAVNERQKEGFPDGLSNTLLLIETSRDPGHWAYGGPTTLRAFESGAAHIGPGQAFGGLHNGGPALLGPRTHSCNALRADGSYRTLTTKIDPAVLEGLATVGGKEALPAEW